MVHLSCRGIKAAEEDLESALTFLFKSTEDG